MQMQKLRSLCWEHRAVNVFPLKLGVGQNTATHASPAVWNFLLVLISTLLVHSPTLSFSTAYILNCISYGYAVFLLTLKTKEVTLLIIITDWSRFLCQVLSVCCWLCCVQNCDTAFYVCSSDSCFELVHTNCKSVILSWGDPVWLTGH